MNVPAELIWFIVGLVLILLEFAAPGVIIVFFGAGAWITALVTWLGLADSLSLQLLVWAASSALLLLILRRRLADRFHGFETGRQDPMANLDEVAGREVLVTEDVGPDHRRGRVEFKGADWNAVAPVHIAAGRLAVIESIDGLTLHVRPVVAGAANVVTDDTNEGE